MVWHTADAVVIACNQSRHDDDDDDSNVEQENVCPSFARLFST